MSARSCLRFFTQWTRCHWTSAHSAEVTPAYPGNRVQSGSTRVTLL